MDVMINETMPHDKEAEQGIIASILSSHSNIEEVLCELKVEHFYIGAHRVIYETMLELHSTKDEIDDITVGNRLAIKEKLDTVGGKVYLRELQKSGWTSLKTQGYVGIVVKKARCRELIKLGKKLINLGYEEPDGDITAEVTGVVHEFALGDSNKNEVTYAKELVKEHLMPTVAKMIDSPDGLLGYSTGFKDLDRITRGMQGGKLVVIAARPGMGKTALGVNILQNAAKKDINSLMFSLEMDEDEIITRMLYTDSTITENDILNGLIDKGNEYWKKTEDLSKLPFGMCTQASITVEQIKNAIKKESLKRKVDMVLVDYLQIMGNDNNGRKNATREQEVSAIARGLKNVAFELNIPIIALAQLGRGVEQRQVKRPMLSDLRESGEIENAANVVLMLYRDDYYNPDSEKKNITEVIVVKNRGGDVGTIELLFEKQHSRFRDLSKYAQEQYTPQQNTAE